MRIAGMAGVVVVAAGLLWLVLSTTIAQVIASRQPGTALAWNDANADAQAESAWKTLQDQPRRPDIARARMLALGALRRDPGNVVAIRTMGFAFAAERQPAKAQRMFRYSESLSRRDVPTQLWMIESEVLENDIAGALSHYDRALRTSSGAREMLIPVLVRASADPGVARHLGRLMAQRPEWWSAAIGPIVGGTPNPAALPVFLGELRLDMEKEEERTVLVHALRRLVEAGQISAAARLYRGASPSSNGLAGNGDFNRDRALPPFDWDLFDEPALAARIQSRREGDPALFLIADSGRGGQIARQLLTLPPGHYELTALVGQSVGEAPGRPVISLHCAAARGGGAGAPLTEARFPVAPASGRRITLRFQVPRANCAAQWMAISVSSGLDSNGNTPWIDQIRLRPL